jgi:glycosyltransferase involved in cell wall biosynthesis
LTCRFRPAVVICQNLLPFESRELRRYRISISKLRLAILSVLYSFSLKRAHGVIFLTEYARKKVFEKTGQSESSSLVVHHGVSTGFFRKPQLQRSIDDYSIDRPFRLIYISSVDVYKNHPKVVAAVSALRSSTGWPIVIDFLGKSFPQASEELSDCLEFHDPAREWAFYHGWRDEPVLIDFLKRSDLGLFASSCENLPISLLVTMASGLPIVSSSLGPMPEILGDSAMYFNPYEAKDIASVLEKVIGSKDARQEMAKKSYERSLEYEWSKCTHETFSFLSRICKNSPYSRRVV